MPRGGAERGVGGVFQGRFLVLGLVVRWFEDVGGPVPWLLEEHDWGCVEVL